MRVYRGVLPVVKSLIAKRAPGDRRRGWPGVGMRMHDRAEIEVIVALGADVVVARGIQERPKTVAGAIVDLEPPGGRPDIQILEFRGGVAAANRVGGR